MRDLARSKSGARNSILVARVGGKGPSTWVSTHRLPGHTNWELHLKRSSQHSNRNFTTISSFTCYATMPAAGTKCILTTGSGPKCPPVFSFISNAQYPGTRSHRAYFSA